MKITIEKELEPFWGAEELETDEEVIELLREDIIAVLDGATWRIER